MSSACLFKFAKESYAELRTEGAKVALYDREHFPDLAAFPVTFGPAGA